MELVGKSKLALPFVGITALSGMTLRCGNKNILYEVLKYKYMTNIVKGKFWELYLNASLSPSNLLSGFLDAQKIVMIHENAVEDIGWHLRPWTLGKWYSVKDEAHFYIVKIIKDLDLENLYKVGPIHQDIKFRNVFLTINWRWECKKLVDFEIVKPIRIFWLG